MRIRRLLGTVVATALVATPLALVATATPAAAASPTIIAPSTGTSWISYNKYSRQPGAAVSGDTIYFYIDVKSTDGTTDPYAGTVTVQRLLAGQSTWTTIGTGTAGYYGSTKLVSNATYRATYSGGTSGSSSWAASTDAKSIKVQRAFDITPKSGKKLGLAGKVKPAGKVKLTVLKKHGKKWKKFKSLKTKANGKFMVRLPAPKKRGAKLFWRIDIKGSSTFAPTKSAVYYTTKY
jgi:hypothetical protein